jgi:hypothetical protein
MKGHVNEIVLYNEAFYILLLELLHHLRVGQAIIPAAE